LLKKPSGGVFGVFSEGGLVFSVGGYKVVKDLNDLKDFNDSLRTPQKP